jgi:hypothetical protein
MWIRTPIYEPKGTNFRPYSLETLIAFLIGRCVGGLWRRAKRAVTRSA